MPKKSTPPSKSLSGMKNLEKIVNDMANENNKSPMTLDKLGTKVDKLGFVVEKLSNKTDKIETNLDKLATTVDKLAIKTDDLATTVVKLAEITANSFTEVNGRLGKVEIEIKEVKKDTGEIKQNMFSQERIQIAETERNDRQDIKIKELETKCCK